MVDLEGFTRGEFSYDSTTHVVYRRGKGPGVVVIHEVPGRGRLSDNAGVPC